MTQAPDDRSRELAEAALVLGAAVYPDGRPSAALKRRALHAARLYRDGRVRLIIASGGPPGAIPTEAEAIRALCLGAGVPAEAILAEPRAATTAENILFSLPILKAHGITRLCLVTDRYHARRAEMMARATGLSARASCPAPTGASRWRLLRLYLREALARLLYRYRHWRQR